MSSTEQDVEDVWAEMQLEQPRACQNGGKTGKNTGKTYDISSLQRESTRAKPLRKKNLDASLQWMQQWATPLKLQAEIGCWISDLGSEADGVATMEVLNPPRTFVDVLENVPCDTPETFLAYVQRDINCISEENLGVRLQSLQKLERVIVQKIDNLSTDIVDVVADTLLKPILKRMKDKSQKCRELSVKILRCLVENASDLSRMLGYVFPILVARLGCEDLDGIAHLPEVMRPDPEQKPVEIGSPVEECEEVRLELAYFVANLLRRCNANQVYSYIDEATGLLRAGAMDPFHEVKAVSCNTMIAFCYSHSEMLLHFSEPLGRSLMSCLTHNHSKIRIAGLQAVTAVFWCGVWKHNFTILQQLMAWQDPNKAPVKAFYEPLTNVNYMSSLTFDRHPAVRRFWFETIAYWLLKVPDKVDHEPYLFPYLLSGLCDENEEIALEVFWLIERCGELYEIEKEDELRKTKQYGFDYSWTYGGRAFVPFPLQAAWGGGKDISHFRRSSALGPDFLGDPEFQDEHAPRDKCSDHVGLGERLRLPDRDYAWPLLQDLDVYRMLPRPRLGSRCWVRTHARRYIKATFNDVVDFRECTALNAGRLLCMSLAYTEEGITEWLQPMSQALVKFYCGRAWAAKDSSVCGAYDTVCKQLGAFLDPLSYWEQFRNAFSPDSPLDLDQRIASVRILAMCVEGSIETLRSIQPPDPSLGLGRCAPIIPDIITLMHDSDLLRNPSKESRSVLWNLIFSFLEFSRPHLGFTQVSQLLFVTLALAANSVQDTSTTATTEALAFEVADLVDETNLNKSFEILGAGLDAGTTAAFTLDSLDDDILPSAPGNQSKQYALFELALPEVLARSDMPFEVFKSVVYLTPITLLVSKDHAETILKILLDFGGIISSSPATRMASLALGAHLGLRCARFLAEGHQDEADGKRVRTFLWRLVQQAASEQLEGSQEIKHISYMVLVSGISAWRKILLNPIVDPVWVLLSPNSSEPSKLLEWLTALFSDQELYKRFHVALEYAETVTTGRDKDGFVIKKTRQLREESDHRASVLRCFAISTVIIAIRRLMKGCHENALQWHCSQKAGSLAAVFRGATSIFSEAKPKMDPPFVKPTPAYMKLYAAELARLLLHRKSRSALSPYKLLDDAARAIHHLPPPPGLPDLPPDLDLSSREALANDFMVSLVDLNLTLPPDPNAKHAPATLDDSGGVEIALGFDVSLNSAGPAVPDLNTPVVGPVVPPEISRVLAQTPECLGWNAALAMYMLGVDLTVICKDGFQHALVKWMRRKEQAKVLIAHDLLKRAQLAIGS